MKIRDMKKIYILVAAMAMLTGLAGCEEQEAPVSDNEGNGSEVTPPDINGDQTMALTASAKEVTLDSGKLTETALTFTWTAARELPEEYEVAYKAELDLASNDFSAAETTTVADGELAVSYTHEKLQSLITEKWSRPMSAPVELAFRVTASWTGGSQTPDPEVCTETVTVTPYAVSVELPDFAADEVSLGGTAVPAGASVQKTLENESVFAIVQEMEEGDLTIPVKCPDGTAAYICPVSGNGLFKDGEPIPAVMKTLPENWAIPSAGAYRVVVSMTDKTVTMYSPGNEFNKNYSLTWYIAGKPASHPNAITSEVTGLWLRGDWDKSKNSWGWGDGVDMKVIQSAADPQIFVYDGEALSSGTKNHFAILQSIVWDSGDGKGETTWNINNVPVITPPRKDDDTDGVSDNYIIKATLGEWMDISIGSDLREVFWTTPSGINFIVFDLRNMKIRMETK